MSTIGFEVARPALRRGPDRAIGVRAAGRIRRAAALLATWQRRAQERRELLELDERQLRDIGVSREQAWHEANKPFWRA